MHLCDACNRARLRYRYGIESFSKLCVDNRKLSRRIERMQSLTSSRHTICDESTDVFHATLPPCLPPTFKGLGVRYQYVVMISAQCAKQPMQSIRMPFVLLCPLAALRKISSMQTNSVFNPRPSFIPQTLIVRNASSHTIGTTHECTFMVV